MNNSPYRYIVEFNKVFTSGSMSGMTIRDSVRFATWQSAEDYRTGTANRVITPCVGGSKYRVENPILTAI